MPHQVILSFRDPQGMQILGPRASCDGCGCCEIWGPSCPRHRMWLDWRLRSDRVVSALTRSGLGEQHSWPCSWITCKAGPPGYGLWVLSSCSLAPLLSEGRSRVSGSEGREAGLGSAFIRFAGVEVKAVRMSRSDTCLAGGIMVHRDLELRPGRGSAASLHPCRRWSRLSPGHPRVCSPLGWVAVVGLPQWALHSASRGVCSLSRQRGWAVVVGLWLLPAGQCGPGQELPRLGNTECWCRGRDHGRPACVPVGPGCLAVLGATAQSGACALTPGGSGLHPLHPPWVLTMPW